MVKGDWITSSKPAKIAFFSVSLSINAEQATKNGQYFASIDDYFLKNELFWFTLTNITLSRNAFNWKLENKFCIAI